MCATRSAANARPLDLILNDTPAPQPQMAFVSTDPDGSGAGDGFDFWGVEEVTLTLAEGVNTIELAIPAGTNTGPNIDAVALAAPGATVEFPITDTTADAGGDLAAGYPDDHDRAGRCGIAPHIADRLR